LECRAATPAGLAGRMEKEVHFSFGETPQEQHLRRGGSRTARRKAQPATEINGLNKKRILENKSFKYSLKIYFISVLPTSKQQVQAPRDLPQKNGSIPDYQYQAHLIRHHL
jgi:hypothetical protein